MAIKKNFVVKNGIEVNNNLIFADTNSNKVGIATTVANYTLHVNGGIGATNLYVYKDLNLGGRISIGNSYGSAGSYLISTGAGVTWTKNQFRYTQTYTAISNQTEFDFSYNPSAGIDVYINGVRLSPAEYTAISGTTVILNSGCYSGDTVDLIAYSVSGVGAGITGITGLTILDEGISVGNDGNIVSINFVGAAITSSASGFGVTVSVIGGIWDTNINDDLYTLENVGISTNNPQFDLDVGGNINFTGTLYQNGEEYVASRWIAGVGNTIYRPDNGGFVGIGSTMPQKTLDVAGDINFSGSLFQGGSAFVASRWTAGIGDSIYKLSGNVGIATTNPSQNLDVNGNVRIRGSLVDAYDNVGTAGSILYTGAQGIYWSEPVGSQGTQGTFGSQGSQGLQGTQGTQGVQGLSNQGVQGTQGLQGLQGTQGVQGLDGLFAGQGTQGTSGIQGDAGSQGLSGAQGSSGIQGDIGAQGSQGLQGTQGVQGLSNQGVQGTQGLQGLQGTQGVQGLSNQGVQGTQGHQGLQGLQGAQGHQGTQGTQGTQGIQGLSNQGVQGTQGLSNQGVQGSQGAQGIQGLQGLQGLQGTFGPATIPQTSVGVAYTVTSSDNGKHISITTGGVTVPVNLGFISGDNVVIFNDSGSNQTVTSGVGITMYLAGTASTGNRTLYQRGLATILCISTNRYVISGAGLT